MDHAGEDVVEISGAFYLFCQLVCKCIELFSIFLNDVWNRSAPCDIVYLLYRLTDPLNLAFLHKTEQFIGTILLFALSRTLAVQSVPHRVLLD